MGTSFSIVSYKAVEKKCYLVILAATTVQPRTLTSRGFLRTAIEFNMRYL